MEIFILSLGFFVSKTMVYKLLFSEKDTLLSILILVVSFNITIAFSVLMSMAIPGSGSLFILIPLLTAALILGNKLAKDQNNSDTKESQE